MKNFYIEAGGDIEVSGKNKNNQNWIVGIRSPFDKTEIIKRLSLTNAGIATSGIYERGNHIYNPHHLEETIRDVVSLSIVGPNIYEADRFATACFAMGPKGLEFIERLKGFEGLMIKRNGEVASTKGFYKYEMD